MGSEIMFERSVRRRLNSKSPSSSALVAVSTTSVLPSSCQQPKPTKSKPGSFGHYAVLGISRSATAEQVRHAYRRKALEVHPDKLGVALGREPTADEVGEAERFYCCVVNAFEVLSDDKRREEYDALFAPQDSVGDNLSAAAAADEAPLEVEPHAVAAEKVLEAQREARLLLQDAHAQGRTIEASRLSAPVLFAMRNHLRGERRSNEQEETQQSSGQGFSSCSRKKLDPCLRSKGHGYEVCVQWAYLMVVSGVTLLLEQALAWRAALTFLKSKAQSRLRSAEAAKQAEAPPILREELNAALRMEPDIAISFVCRFKLGPTPVDTPRTTNLDLALSLKGSFRELLPGARRLERMQAKARKAVERDKQQAKRYYSELLKRVSQELDRRFPQLVYQAGLSQLLQQRVRAAEQKVQQAAASTELRALLGLEAAEEASAALSLLRQLPPEERKKRVKAMLRPARSLPPPSSPATHNAPANLPGAAPPRVLAPLVPLPAPLAAPLALPPPLAAPPPSPRTAKAAGSTMTLKKEPMAPALLKVTPRPTQQPTKVRQARRQKGPGPQSQEFLPKKLLERVLHYLDFMEVDCARVAGTLLHGIGAKVYWDRCQIFSCPSEFVCAVRFSSRGRRLAHRGNTATSLTVALLAQPWLKTHFEHLKFKMTGSEMLDNRRLLTALSQMPHLTVVELPPAGWGSLTSKLRLARTLKNRGIHVD